MATKAKKDEPAPPSVEKPKKSGRRVSVLPPPPGASAAYSSSAQNRVASRDQEAAEKMRLLHEEAERAYALIDTWMSFATNNNLSAIAAQLDHHKYGQLSDVFTERLKAKSSATASDASAPAASASRWPVDIMDRASNTALFYAVWHGRLEAVNLLIARGANVKHSNETKSTPAHLAVVMMEHSMAQIDTYIAILTALFKAGADANAKNEHSESPSNLLQRSEALQSCIELPRIKQAMNLLASANAPQMGALAVTSVSAAYEAQRDLDMEAQARAKLTRASSTGVTVSLADGDGGGGDVLSPTSARPTSPSASVGSPLGSPLGGAAFSELPAPLGDVEAQKRKVHTIAAYKALFKMIQRYGIDADDPSFNAASSYLSPENLQAFFGSCGVALSALDTALMFAIMDVDRDDCVDDSDFLKVMLGYDESAFGASCAHAFRLLDADGDGRITATDVRDAAKSVGAVFCCANDREVACVLRSLVPPVKAGTDFKPASVALSRRHVEHWAAQRLTYDELREHEAREAAAAAAFATERMRAMGGGGGGGGFGRRASAMAGGRRSSMYTH